MSRKKPEGGVAYRSRPSRRSPAPTTSTNCFREEVWDRDGRPHSVFFYEHDGHTVWGLTARILKQFVEVVGGPLQRDGWLR